MKNILFIVGSYLPTASANGICCDAIMKKYIDLNYNVYCIANQEKNISDFEICNGIKVFRVKKYKFSFGPLNLIIKVLHRIIQIFIYPHTGNFSRIKRTFKLANKIVNLYKIEMIIAVHKPIEALIVGDKLKKKYPELLYIPYMLDSLSGGFDSKFMPRNYAFKSKLKFEKKIFNSADYIMAMEYSKPILDSDNYLEFIKKILFVDIPLFRNLSEEVDIKKCFNNKKINIVYTGTLPMKIRNPEKILKIFSDLCKNNTDIELHFYSQGYEDILNDYKKQMESALQIHGHVPVNEAYNAICNADILLNISNNMQYQIPSKIFEYFSTGKPIINFVFNKEDPATIYYDKYPNIFNINDWDCVCSKDEILSFIKNAPRSIDIDEIAFLYYKNRPEYFLECLKNAINNN